MKYTLIVSKDGPSIVLKESDSKKEIEEFWECVKGCQRLAGYERKKEEN
jgi:hypothetical protein